MNSARPKLSERIYQLLMAIRNGKANPSETMAHLQRIGEKAEELESEENTMKEKTLRMLRKVIENAPEPDERNVALGRALGEMALANQEFIGDFYTDAGLERILRMTGEEHQEELDRKSRKHQEELDRIMKKYSPKKE